MARLEIRGNLANDYADVFTAEAVDALEALAPLDDDRKALMTARITRRLDRAGTKQRIAFLDPGKTIGRTGITVAQARAGDFVGSEIPGGSAPPVDSRHWTRPPSATVRSRAASATSRTPCCRAPTAGCSTARTRSGQIVDACRSTISAT